MPLFSILVPAYNNKQYLPACIESVKSQDCDDWELAIVDDGSADGTAELIREYADADPRIVAVVKEQNEGTHLARNTAVEKATGEWLIFLDADDELAPGALAGLAKAVAHDDADMVHFGIEAVDAGVNEDERTSFEAFINAEVPVLEGADILESICSPSGESIQDWRVTQRAYASEMLKRAYAAMTRERLGRAQDGYEFFVIASIATRQLTRNDVIGVRYYYGRGLNGSTDLSVERFVKDAQGFQASIDAIADYATSFDAWDIKPAYEGTKAKMLQLLFNDWSVRVPAADKLGAARQVASVIGNEEAATELARLARDEAYAQLVEEQPLDPQAPSSWLGLAAGLVDGTTPGIRYRAYAYEANQHLSNLANNLALRDFDDEDVRIFVSAHKPVELFDSKVLQPIQVGSALATWRFPDMLHDDVGENISTQNAMYCELTGQYWAWKNVDADYYGFCHYRRYFSFAPKNFGENSWGEIERDDIDRESQELFGLTDAQIREAVQGYDVLTTGIKDIRRFPGKAKTPLEQYAAAEHLHEEDLLRVIEILLEEHPEYADDVEEYLYGNASCFCNMFIMKREMFHDYCAWLFPILERFVNETDMSLYSKEGLRTPGHLSERLLNIYLMHAKRANPDLRHRELQCVHFMRPDKKYIKLAPTQEVEKPGSPIIPVVFAADDNYAAMLLTTIVSMLENASSDYRYDIVILDTNISARHKKLISDTVSRYPGASVRFFNAAGLIDKYELTTSNKHIGNETYYRFLIQKILPYYDKVLYLDSDLIIEGDVAELFETDVEGMLLAAARDIDYLGNLNMPDGERIEYSREMLGMKNPYDYFQAGVLLLNTAEMRKLHSTYDWLTFASNPDFIYNDQDVLNAQCEGNVVYLDMDWNVMHDCGSRVANVFSFAPAALYGEYLDSRAHPRVIHYAGWQKPWNTPRCDMADRYWHYARLTPLYEELLENMAAGAYEAAKEKSEPPRAVSDDSPMRRVVDPLMPLGSKRREVAKAVGRKVLGRG